MDAWLMIRGMDREEWRSMGGVAWLASLGGSELPNVYVPGLIFSFRALSDSARAALRFQSIWRQSRGAATQPPPMVVDISGNEKRLSIAAFDLKPGDVLVTGDAGRFLSAEPIEMTAGPTVHLEDGQVLSTHLILHSSHNFGWALPSVDVASASKGFRATRAPVAPVVNVTIERERKFFPYIPWKLALVMAVAAFALLMAYRVTVRLARELGSETQTASQPEGFIGPMTLADLTKKETPDPEPLETAVPEGFGSIVIRTDPPDAFVYLNNSLVGERSPVVLANQSNKKVYSLRVQRKGYQSYSNFFNVEADKEKILEVRLTKPSKTTSSRKR